MTGERPLAESLFIRGIGNMLGMSHTVGDLENSGVMGLLREVLLASLIEPLLVPPYKAGTGVIVDSRGHQSGQCDIIVWDDSIFRPVYSVRGAGIYAIESVVLVVEVKSTLELASYRQAAIVATQLKGMKILKPAVQGESQEFWIDEPGLLPLHMVFGFKSDAEKSEADRAHDIANEIGQPLHQFLQVACVPGKSSWAFQADGDHEFAPDADSHYEVRMPVCGIVNSLKYVSEKRGKPNLGAYLVP